MTFINAPLFIISLAVGLFLVYISSPKFEIVTVYPTPENENKFLYQDKGGTCYRFKSKEVNCPTDGSSIEKIPIQRGGGSAAVTDPGFHIT